MRSLNSRDRDGSEERVGQVRLGRDNLNFGSSERLQRAFPNAAVF